MPPEDARAYLTRQWLEKADHDLVAAQRLAESPPVTDVVVFHCQQAAEKALKAFLCWHDRAFRRTHDLVELIRECASVDAGFLGLQAAGEVLNAYAIEPRYPGDQPPPTLDAMVEARALAQEVIAYVRHRLPAEAQAAGAQNPVQAVSQFYTLVSQHRFEAAAVLWTPRMQASYPPAEHLHRRFSATQQLTVSTSLVSVDEAVGRATVGVAVTEVTGSPPVTRRWAGTWQVVRTPAGWLLDQPHLAPG